MNLYLSRKIAFFHIFGVLLVLPIHTFFPCSESFSVFRHIFVLLCRSFQPIYFGLAGYLFFMGYSRGNGYKIKLLKRINTLLFPYLIWNMLLVILMYLLYRNGVESSLIEKAAVYFENISVVNIIKYIFWQPAAGHLWFIRDLILVSVLSCPLYYAINKKKWYSLLILFVLALMTTQTQTASLFSFAVGGYLSLNDVNIQKIDKKIIYVSMLICLGLLVYFTYNYTEHNAIPLLSWSTAVLLWTLYDQVIGKDSNFDVSKWRGSFFFIYLFHDPLLNITCAYTSKLLSHSFVADLFLFMGVQVFVISVALMVSKLLSGYFPWFYSVLVGSRRK